jgi:hypothetical protein
MKLIMDNGLKCRCGSERLFLDNVWLQRDEYGYGAFTFYIYFRCDYCTDVFRYAHKKDQKRLTIKQQHINRAIVLNPTARFINPPGGMSRDL